MLIKVHRRKRNDGFISIFLIILECEKCGDWFHFACIGFKGTIEAAHTMNFICN